MKNNNYRFFILCLFVFLLFSSVSAISTVHSDWVLNVSEGQGETAPGYTDKNPRMVVDGENVHMVWLVDSSYSKTFIYYRRSTNGGNTWGAKKVVFSKPYNDVRFNNTEWQLAVSGDNVHILVAGYERGDSWYGTLNHIRSTNGGQSFEEAVEIVTAGKAYHVTDIFVDCEGDNLSIGYRIQYNASVDNSYYIKRSSDNGNNFQEKHVYSADSGSDWEVWDVLVDGENIYVLYSEQYYMYGLNRRELYFRASNDGGDTFIKHTLSFPASGEDHMAMNLQDEHYLHKIASEGDDVFIIFCALDENNEKHLYYTHSPDMGQSLNDPVNLTKNKIPEGYEIIQAHEEISVKGTNVNIVFKCENNAIFTIHSGDKGVSFDNPKIIADRDAYAIGKGTWPSISSGPSEDKFYVFYTWPTLAVSDDGGQSFSIPTIMAPYFSTNGQLGQNFKYPNLQIDDKGNVHMAFCAYFNYGDDYDIHYRKYSFDQEGSNNTSQALSLDYNYSDKIWDNMQIMQRSFNMSESFTLEIFVKPAPECPAKAKFIAKDMNYGFNLKRNNSYQPFFEYITAENGKITITSEEIMENDTWTHLAITFDNTIATDNLKLYMNGQIVASGNVSGSLGQKDGYLILGNTRYNDYFYGLMDELRIWNRVLTASEIQAGLQGELAGTETGLEAYFNFNSHCMDMTGNGNDGVFMYKESFVDSDFASVAREDENRKPNKFSLKQNYPNPFNPETIIQFSIPNRSHVNIAIYDIQGKKLETLVNNIHNAGEHSIKWNAIHYSAGIYFYRISTSNLTKTKKCILMK